MTNVEVTNSNKLLQNSALVDFKKANFLPQPKHLSLQSRKLEQLQDTAVEALWFFFSNQYEKISDQHLQVIKRYFLSSKIPWKNSPVFSVQPIVITPIQAVKHKPLAMQQGNLDLLIAECQSESFAIDLVSQAVNIKLSLPSPFSDGRAYCQESYEAGNGMNCLRFTDGQNTFFLIQRISSADGLYFPNDNLAISFGYFQARHVKLLQTKLLKDFAQIVAYAKSVNRFGGILVSHRRPAHFYYEIWPVLLEIHKRPEIYEKIPNVIMRKDHDFVDLDALLGATNNLVLETQQIDDRSFHGNQWFIHMGTHRYLWPHQYCYEKADHYLVNKLINSPSEHAKALSQQVEDCYPLIWIGIEGQKRCWIEQVDGYVYMLNQWAKKYPKLGVVFDGWTLPFTPSSKSVIEAEKDRQLSKKIIKRLDANIKSVSIIGENSHTKVVIGNKTNFFITNFATGSLHISRLLHKPGFCHLSSLLAEHTLQAAIQIHPNPNVYLLPKQYVHDHDLREVSVQKQLLDAVKQLGFKDHVAQKMEQELGTISYSIDKAVFYQFIEERLSKVLANTTVPKLRIFIEPACSVNPMLRQSLKMAAHGNILIIFPWLKNLKTMTDLLGFTPAFLQRNLIYGNFAFGCHRLLYADTQQVDYFIWLRNPFLRLNLHVQQFLKNAENNQKPSDFSRVLSAGHKVLDNLYTRRVSGIDAPFGKCTETMLAVAIENLNKHFVFIGIDEHPDASFDNLCQMMDWDRAHFPDVTPINTTINQIQFSENDKLQIDKMIQFDLRLYAAALEMLNRK